MIVKYLDYNYDHIIDWPIADTCHKNSVLVTLQLKALDRLQKYFLKYKWKRSQKWSLYSLDNSYHLFYKDTYTLTVICWTCRRIRSCSHRDHTMKYLTCVLLSMLLLALRYNFKWQTSSHYYLLMSRNRRSIPDVPCCTCPPNAQACLHFLRVCQPLW